MVHRRVAVLSGVTVLAVGLGLSAPVAGAQERPVLGGVWNILPPGQSGTITAPQLAGVLLTDPINRIAVDGRNAPRNFADQLERYDALNRVDPATLDESDLGTYYKRSVFEVAPQDVARVERPKPGVTITWDRDGVPHVVGATDEDVAWGAGYAGTRDRMFLQDVLRHTGAARAAEFLGPSAENIAMDVEQLRAAHYTEQEAADQVVAAAARHGAEGADLLRETDAYLDGINTAQRRMCPLGPLGAQCPAEYTALTRLPSPWTRADLTYVASLVGGIFGKGGGAEADNARWLQTLQARFGVDEGRRIYDDLRSADSPDAPTTASATFPYGQARVDETLPGVALPDLVPTATAPGTGARLDRSPIAGAANPGTLRGPFGVIDLRAGSGMSNAALVAGSHTDDGAPVAVMGPQTGYFTPQLLTEISLSGPGVKARGVAFAGVSLVVQLGRGVDYAWSATSSGGDNVDTVVARLCDPSGAPATVDSEHYLRDGACVPMRRFEHREIALPTLAGPGLPVDLRFLVLRTHHGVVQERTTVDGAPVAVVTQRSTYGSEVDSIVGFSRLNDPGFVRDAGSFADAASEIDYQFNWFYADDSDISYFASGALPVRADGVDDDLPRWADRVYDWQGWLAQAEHPQQTNPPSGRLVSWNNRQAPGFTAADDQWGFGPVHRSGPLNRRTAQARDVGALVGATADAATVDTRAEEVLPALLATIGDPDDPRLAAAVELLRGWDGHRVDRDRDGAYTDQAAIALFDAWWAGPADGTGGVARDVLRGTLGDLVTELPKALDDHPNIGRGSAFNGVAWYGYVVRDLSAAPAGDWHRTYCGGGDTARCRADLLASLDAALDRVLAEQGVSEPAQLTYDKSLDFIAPVTGGVVGTRPIDWQNRPTFQQVVAFG